MLKYSHNISFRIFGLSCLLILVSFIACGKNKTTEPPTLQDGFISTTLVSGTLLKVDVAGNYCYCAANGSLKILSLEDPQNPTLIGEIPTAGQATYIEVIDYYVYILYPSGLMVIDVANPENPQIITDFTEVAGAMEMVRNGNIAVVSNLTDELTILDIGNPRDPTIIGSIDSIAYSVWYMHLEGHILYTNGYNNTTIISIANPASPTIVGYIGSSSPGIIKGYNGYLYLNYGSAGIKIYSIFNPVTPYYVGEIPHNYNMIAFHENYAYLKSAHGYPGRYIDIVDISNPADPVMAGSYATDYEPVSQLHAEDDMLFTFDDSSVRESMLHIADLTTPTEPAETGTFTSYQTYLTDVFVFNNYAFVMQIPYLNIVDVHDIYHPVPMGRISCLGGRSGSWSTLEYYQDYIYIVGPHTPGMSIIDVSDPMNPELAGIYESLDQAEFNDIDLEGNILYVASANQGLLALNISNPAVPELIDETYEGSGCDSAVISVFVEGNYCYISDNCQELKIYDVSDPSNMTFIGECITPQPSNNLYVYGNFAFLPAIWGGSFVVDISDPQNPTPVAGQIGPPVNQFEVRITLAGNSILLPKLDWGADIYNISDPLNFYIERTIDTPNIACGMTAADGIIYVADGSSLCLYRYDY